MGRVKTAFLKAVESLADPAEVQFEKGPHSRTDTGGLVHAPAISPPLSSGEGEAEGEGGAVVLWKEASPCRLAD